MQNRNSATICTYEKISYITTTQEVSSMTICIHVRKYEMHQRLSPTICTDEKISYISTKQKRSTTTKAASSPVKQYVQRYNICSATLYIILQYVRMIKYTTSQQSRKESVTVCGVLQYVHMRKRGNLLSEKRSSVTIFTYEKIFYISTKQKRSSFYNMYLSENTLHLKKEEKKNF